MIGGRHRGSGIETKQQRGTRFLVHGHSSKEGNPDYNFRLACHRANNIGEKIISVLKKLNLEQVDAEVRSRVEVGSRGPTSEFSDRPQDNRVVVVYGEIPSQTTSPEPECKDAPRHLGDIKPEIDCDPPTKDLTQMDGGPHLTHFHFCFDSDVFAATDASSVVSFAKRQAATANFVIHGFASKENKTKAGAAYDQRLSCHRALRVARELMNAGVRPEQIREVSGLGHTEPFSFGDPKFKEFKWEQWKHDGDSSLQPMRASLVRMGRLKQSGIT